MLRLPLLSCVLSLAFITNVTADELPKITVQSNIFKPTVDQQLNPALTVLNKGEVQRNLSTTLGETLRNIPGVSSTHFSAGSSRPTIRGLGANRVQILDNGSDISDVSSLSDDHALTADGYAAEQIEILRGPAALRYGPSASGGVINIINKRLVKTKEPFSLTASSQYDSATNGETFNVDTNGSYQNFAWHLDALKQDAKDTEIKGYADSDEREHKGKINNTHLDRDVFAIGTAYITPEFRAAFAFTNNDNDYGLPSKHEEEHSAMSIDMRTKTL